jgi:hypothetical protein
MPRPTDPERYPLAFGEAVAYTVATAPKPLFIPTSDPAALRSQFYGYFRALRSTGDTAVADAIAIYIKSNPPGIELTTRDATAQALTVSAALAAARGSAQNPQHPFEHEAPEQPNLPSA